MATTHTCPSGRRVTFKGNRVPSQGEVLRRCQSAGRNGARKVSKPTPGQAAQGKSRAKQMKNATSVNAFSIPFDIPGIGSGGPVPPSGGGGGGFVGDACQLLPPGRARKICEAGGDIIGGFLGDNGNGNGGPAPCPDGKIRVGDACVAPGDAFPGGDPFITGAGGQAVEGAFGMPGITPTVEQRTHRSCPEGMVLGKDDLCYPKAVLSRRSRFRKWRQPPRPKVSHADWKAIRKAERIKDKLKDLTKKHPGLRTAKNR